MYNPSLKKMLLLSVILYPLILLSLSTGERQILITNASVDVRESEDEKKEEKEEEEKEENNLESGRLLSTSTADDGGMWPVELICQALD